MAATDRASATSTSDSTHPRPGGILLDDKVHVVAGYNATTARALSLGGHAVDVTLDIADPSEPLPVAIVRIHCPEPSTRFTTDPRVVGAEGPLLLISVRFELEYYELFLYDYEVPHLLSIPAPPSTLKHVMCFAVLPRGGRAGGHLLAAIDYVGNSFDQGMLVFSTEDRSWATKPIANPPWPTSFLTKVRPDKAITVGEKKALWADLDQGVILLSDFSNDPPVLQYILVPSAGADPKLEKLISPTFSVGMCRDVSFANGFIKFIEIENRVTFTYQPQYATAVPPVNDADLISSKKPSFPEPDLVCTVNGWRLVKWSRTIAAEAWSSRLVVDVDDIDFTAQSAEGFTYQKIHSHLPAIAIDGDDNTIWFGDQTGYLVSVDMGNRALKAFAPLPLLPPRTEPIVHVPSPRSTLAPVRMWNQQDILPRPRSPSETSSSDVIIS